MSVSTDVNSGIAALSLDPPAFKYDPFESPRNEIRLLRVLPRSDGLLDTFSDMIRCEIFHTNLETSMPYKALSYTWGSPGDPHFMILLNGKKFRVRENLWLALQQFTASEQAIYWIDAITINQRDDQERSKQVAMMKTIYERAKEVVIWLGPAENNSDLAIKLIQDLYDVHDSEEKTYIRLQVPEAKPDLVAVVYLLDRPYWRRMWIVQELSVAKRITLLCGSRRLSIEALEALQEFYRTEISSEKELPLGFLNRLLPSGSVAHSVLASRGIAGIRTWQKAFASQNLTYFECLLYHWTRVCTDQRDMVYGLSALANSRSQYQITIDYSLTTAEVYFDLARKEIQEGKDLMILTRAFNHVGPHVLPSWVPNWSLHLYGHTHLPHRLHESGQRILSAAGTSAKEVFISRDTYSVNLKGVALGLVRNVGVKTDMENEDDFEAAVRTFKSWWSLLPILDGQVVDIQFQFGATIVCNQFPDDLIVSFGKAGVSCYILAIIAELCKKAPVGEVIDPLLTAYAFSESDGVVDERGGQRNKA